MKFNGLLIILAGLLCTFNSDLISQTQQKSKDLLVSTDCLAENLSDSLLVILHYGMKSEYKKEHIPGARYVNIWDILVKNEQGLKHELPDEEKTEQALRSLGINNESRIIICYEDGNAIPMAARLYFTLDYAGLGDQVRMLDGGLKAWKNEERPLSEKAPDYKEGQVDIKIKEDVRADKDEVRTGLDRQGVSVVDARPPERFYGIETDQNSTRQGHIQGAVNLPFFELTKEDSSHYFKEEVGLRSLFEERGIKTDTMMMVYCGSGIWASPVYFIARILGYKVRLYDGSFQEWGKDESLPVSKRSTKPRAN